MSSKRVSWRLIDLGPDTAFRNMALDEAISISVREESATPTLRLYGWLAQSLSIGCFQGAEGIDFEYCDRNSIPIVRRPTGGRAILHGKELTYSFSSRLEGRFSGSLRESYGLISRALSLAFERLGVNTEMDGRIGRQYSRSPLCFQSSSYGELSSGGIKLAGSAQRRWKDGFLQQGSIPYETDNEKTTLIFGKSAPERPSISIDNKALRHEIVKAFEETFSVSLIKSGLLPREEALAEELIRTKYGLRDWNLRSQDWNLHRQA